MPKESSAAVEPDEREQERVARPRRRPETNNKPKPQLPHAVILHNDPINGFEYVIGVLRKVFHYNGFKAFWLTLKAHTTCRSIVWSGVLEVAELKADQVRSCGPDPRKVKDGAQSLTVTTEPLPG
jgi:ATP-dependent Clp protease adaptor protein ClpS